MAPLRAVDVIFTVFISAILITCASGLRFRNEPGTVTVYAGETVYFRCDVYTNQGAPPANLRVTWMKADSRNARKIISVSGVIVSAFADPNRFSQVGDPELGEHDLMITNVQYEDAGMYWCQVSTSGQYLESRMGRLTVQVPVPIPVCSVDQPTPTVGQRVTFNCQQQMHPEVNYEALNWWDETTRRKVVTQRRYSDGSISFVRVLTESDRNRKFVCIQGLSFVEGQRNCSVLPLPAPQISTPANLAQTIIMNPEVKYVTEGSSATFGCTSSAGPVSRWIFGYGSSSTKIRQTYDRFLVSSDRSELTIIRTTLRDNGRAVRCVVLTSTGDKLIGQSVLNVLAPGTEPAATIPKIPPPPPSTSRPTTPTTPPTTKAETTQNDTPKQSTSHTQNTETESQTTTTNTGNKGNTETNVNATTNQEPSTRRDAGQIGASNPDVITDAGTITSPNTEQNNANAPKIQSGGVYRSSNPHQVSSDNNGNQRDSSAAIVGAVLGSLLLIALVVLAVFLVKTKRYPKTMPVWFPPALLAVLKRPSKKQDGATGNENGPEVITSGKQSIRLKRIEVVVNPPPPDWQFRLKDVEGGDGKSVAPLNNYETHEGPVYANLTPELTKACPEEDPDDDDNDSLFSSDFDDDMDLEGEISATLAQMAANPEPIYENRMSLGPLPVMTSVPATAPVPAPAPSPNERKSKNVEGLVYAQLDLGPDAVKRSTIFIEGEKTQYAHIQHGNSAKRK